MKLLQLLVVTLLFTFAGNSRSDAVSASPDWVVDGINGDDAATGDREHPLKTLSAAIAKLPDPVTRPVAIHWIADEETQTGGHDMAVNCLELMRRMRPGVRVAIIGMTNRMGRFPCMAWEGGSSMVTVREGDWWLENVQIGTGAVRQRRGVMVSGPGTLTLNHVTFRTRSLSDAAIHAQRGGVVQLLGAIRINEHLHEQAGPETFAGIVAIDHGMVRFAQREGASLEIGNGSLSAAYYGVIGLGCRTARITSWGEQSNCLAVNNSGRIDLHDSIVHLRAKLPQNTPIGLEHDGHVLAEGARIAIEGTNRTAIVLQKASTLTGNSIELRGSFPTSLSAMSGSMFVGRFTGDITGVTATTGATIHIEAIEGRTIGPATATRGAVISMPDGSVVSGR